MLFTVFGPCPTEQQEVRRQFNAVPACRGFLPVIGQYVAPDTGVLFGQVAEEGQRVGTDLVRIRAPGLAAGMLIRRARGSNGVGCILVCYLNYIKASMACPRAPLSSGMTRLPCD